jgi:V-type H+-transporting ATPase subunit F
MATAPQDNTKNGGLVAIIGDEDTVTGFLLAGIGHRDHLNRVNFLVVDPDRTKHDDIVQMFRQLTTRDDISVILITQNVAQDIRYLISAYDKVIPTILEIPSKDRAYNEGADPIMQRVLRLLGSRD